MKKTLPIIMFITTFMIVYIVICYLPSFQIKLEAEPFEYFIASIKHMRLFKTMVSAVVGTLFAAIPIVIGKINN